MNFLSFLRHGRRAGPEATVNGTKSDRLEVYCYTHPPLYLALLYSALVAGIVGVTVIIIPDLRELLTEFFSQTLPAAIGLVIYSAAVIGIVRALKWGERFKQAPEHPSLVADAGGLVTQWSARIPWTDVEDFCVGNVRGGHFPSVLVSNIADHRYPWWFSRTFMQWEPWNALPVLSGSTLGYLVRRSALGPLEHIGDDELIAELRKFRARLGLGKGARVLDHAQVESSATGERAAGGLVRLWDYATVACFIGVLIALYLSASQDWDWLPPHLLLAALSLVCASFGLRAIYTGEVWFKGLVFYRSRSPIMYWLSVAMIFSFGVLSLLPAVIGQSSTAPASVEPSARAEAARLVMSGYRSGHENRPEEAVALFTRAIQLDPASAEAHYQRAAVYARRGSYEEARADLKRAIDLDPRHFESYRLIDWLLARQGAWEEIIGHWDRFIALEPKNALAHLERAGAYRHKGDMQRALADLDKACGLGNQQACAIQHRR